MLKTTIVAIALLVISGCKTTGGRAGEYDHAAQGIMVGEVTATSAIVQVRVTASPGLVDGDVPGKTGAVRFVLVDADEADAFSFSGEKRCIMPLPTTWLVDSEADANRDFIARVRFFGLSPNTRYRCRTYLALERGPALDFVGGAWRPGDEVSAGPTAEFHTLPGEAVSAPVRFVVVTGMNYAKFHGDPRIDRAQHVVENNTELPPAYVGSDRELGYPALAAIRKLEPDFFVGTGDNVYYDTPDNPRAKTIPELRRKWHEQFVQKRYVELFSAVPTYWEIDDHDYRIDDGDNSGDYDPTPAIGRRMALEQLPISELGDDDAKTYRTHRVSRELQVWFPENRMYRSPNAMTDGPGKTIWGAEQKAWLKRTILESDATFKLLVSPTPMIGPDDLRKTDNHTNVGGFRHERDEFFAWVKEHGLDRRGFFIVCGDRHWQYHSIHPSGIEEFASGALVDANSRPARRPGDPKSTDPDGRIEQPYAQDPPTGGFLEIEVAPATAEGPAALTFRHRDEHGEILHEERKVDPGANE